MIDPTKDGIARIQKKAVRELFANHPGRVQADVAIGQVFAKADSGLSEDQVAEQLIAMGVFPSFDEARKAMLHATLEYLIHCRMTPARENNLSLVRQVPDGLKEWIDDRFAPIRDRRRGRTHRGKQHALRVYRMVLGLLERANGLPWVLATNKELGAMAGCNDSTAKFDMSCINGEGFITEEPNFSCREGRMFRFDWRWDPPRCPTIHVKPIPGGYSHNVIIQALDRDGISRSFSRYVYPHESAYGYSAHVIRKRPPCNCKFD